MNYRPARILRHLGLPSSVASPKPPLDTASSSGEAGIDMTKRFALLVAAFGGISGCKDAPVSLEEHGGSALEDAAVFASSSHGRGGGKGGGKHQGAGAPEHEQGAVARAEVVREESSAQGEVRLYSGAVADLDGDGALELVAGGFAAEEDGRRSTIRVYRRAGEGWTPWLEAGWDGGNGSTARNLEIADVDGDGVLDIVVLGRVGDKPRAAKARMAIFNLVKGELIEKHQVEWLEGIYTHGYGLAIGDLDGDRRPEIATAGFQFDGKREMGFVRIWSDRKGALAMRAEALLGAPDVVSMRVNDLAIGDVDGDKRADLVVAGRRGGVVKGESKRLALDERRESGDLSVLRFAGGKLTTRAHYDWTSGSSLRLRSVVLADLDGDGRAEIVVGGQYAAEGRAAMGLFRVTAGKLVLVSDASTAEQGATGEIKDLVVVGRGGEAHIVATGAEGGRSGRQGNVGSWHLAGGALVRDAEVSSRNADDTRARAVVVVPGADGSTVLTVGHALKQTAMVGQVLRWPMDTP
jgi:FG-GAP-like repeat